LTALTLLRLGAGAASPLTEDEAYYRLWSLRPDFGYFDHPPMIAWWIWLGRRLVGDTALGVRLAPVIGCALTSLLTVDLARLAGASRTSAWRAGLWLNATILIGLGGMLAVPDAPNTLFWTAAVWCAFKARDGDARWWLACGAAAGLACLSKYSALFLAPGLVLWLSLDPVGRRELRRPWPWLGALLALLLFAPNVAWNAAHHWATFDKQFGRVRADGLAPQHLPELIVEQFLLLNPLIAAFLVRATRRRDLRALLAITAPFTAYLLVHSLHASVQGQWPAPLYPIWVIAAAQAADGVMSPWWRRARAVAVGFGVVAVSAAIAFVVAPLDGRVPVFDPAAPLRGWPAFAADVEQARRQAGASWIGATSYGLTAQLAATVRDAPAVEIRERARYSFEQPTDRADFQSPGLVVDRTDRLSSAALKRCFRVVEALPDLHRGRSASGTRYAAYRVALPLRDVERSGC